MAITDKSTDKLLTQIATNAVKESTATAGQAGVVVVNPDGSNIAGGGGSGGAVTIADGANVSQGAVADTAYASGSGTMVSILKGIFTRLRGGQATMANSLPVTISSDQTAFPTSQGIGLEVTASASSAATIFTQDASAYRFLIIQATGTWAGTVAVEGSNDNTNWVAIPLINSVSQANSPVNSFNNNGLYLVPIGSKYLRSRVSSYSSGTVTLVAEFYYSATPLHTMGVSAGQYGTWTVTPIPATSGGGSIYRVLWPANATGVNIKPSAGQLYGYQIANTAASIRYVKLYNKATAPTVGTDTPVLTLGIQPSSSLNFDSTTGIAFAAGIGIGVTNLVADSDTTAPTANDVIVNVFYK